jgi:pimeloyl-ACP methyl ester carboxylesterase
VSATSPDRRQIQQLPALQLGTIVDIDDPRFSDANGELGLWDPLRFLFEVGAGVYFLEAYDPSKIPVLFVHGAVGDPSDWKYLVSTLDRSRFQPWLVYYPSAPHLDRLAAGVVRAIAALQFKYGFSEMILVAHSMGGLVTRAAINYAMENRHGPRVVRIPAFVSISSPWNGHTAAAAGAKHSPVVAPMWQDMAPGSPFLAQLPRTTLPPECEYTLFFSYRGVSMLREEANDGTVAVSSELSMPIQLQADHVLGFNESHTSILQSAEVAEKLNAILARAHDHAHRSDE